jgi:hypothetical protein
MTELLVIARTCHIHQLKPLVRQLPVARTKVVETLTTCLAAVGSQMGRAIMVPLWLHPGNSMVPVGVFDHAGVCGS